MGLYLRFCCLVLGLAIEPQDWSAVSLRIEEDSSVSSDTATLCRVQVVNNGQGTWDGRGIVFEARALRDGRVAARVRGRFGGTLGPHETASSARGESDPGGARHRKGTRARGGKKLPRRK